MSRNLEIESKALLTKQDYYKLSDFFAGSKTIYQVNYYIDTKDYKILSQKSGLRIRLENHKYELTLKVPHDYGRLEINQEITAKVLENIANCKDFPSGDVKKYLTEELKIDVNELKVFGRLSNTRKERHVDGNLFALDCSEYFNNVDYELECESPSLENAKKSIVKLLASYGIEYKENRLNKIERVLKAVNK